MTRLPKNLIFMARITSARRPNRRRKPSPRKRYGSFKASRPLVEYPTRSTLLSLPPATCMLTVRHRDRPGVLQRGYWMRYSAARINVQEMDNVIFAGAEAAVACIHLETAPAATLLDALHQSEPDVFELQLTALDSPLTTAQSPR